MNYTQLSLPERIEAYALERKGMSLRSIATVLGRSHTTISREWKRNSTLALGYRPTWAHTSYERRKGLECSKGRKKPLWVFDYVQAKLRVGWSPEQIAGRLPLEHRGEHIHHETIYRYIYTDPLVRHEKLWQFLRYHRYRRLRQVIGRKVKTQAIDGVIRISERPLQALLRDQAGHWETDNMIGRASDHTVLSALVERKTRYTHLRLLTNKSAQTKADSVISCLGNYPYRVRRTITTDNGTENRNHQDVTEQLGTPVYFCNPYHSWEKGTVENTIGRVRHFLPKKKSLDDVPANVIKVVEEQLNNTPRKCLGYKTPVEAMQEDLMSVSTNKPPDVFQSKPETTWIPEVLD